MSSAPPLNLLPVDLRSLWTLMAEQAREEGSLRKVTERWVLFLLPSPGAGPLPGAWAGASAFRGQDAG